MPERKEEGGLEVEKEITEREEGRGRTGGRKGNN
jgi:hypothetical protein